RLGVSFPSFLLDSIHELLTTPNRNHLIHDLQPYHCTYELCRDPNRLYGSKQEWIDHESQHSRIWYCMEHDIEYETQPEYTDHLTLDHPVIAAEHFSEELLGAAMRPSAKVHRGCPFCPIIFANIREMQDHLATHLERLALPTLAIVESNSGEYEASARSSDSGQAQMPGRLGSLIGDFGHKFGLEKIPFSTLRIGSLVFYPSANWAGGTRLVIYNSSEAKFIYYFPSRTGGCVIEYSLTEISRIEFADGVLTITLQRPPLFFIRRGEVELQQCNDFTIDQNATHDLVHFILQPEDVEESGFQQLVASINTFLESSNTISTQEVDQPDWKIMLELFEKADQIDNDEWLWNTEEWREGSSVETLGETDNNGDIGLGIEGFEWLSEGEYSLAEAIAKMPRLNFSPSFSRNFRPHDFRLHGDKILSRRRT
ncbi:hypothetical protein GGS24DRAFT_409246, partial [Hypoxylon argillaceum]